jgi:hypothetical protein
MEEHIAKYQKMDDKKTSLLQFDVEEPNQQPIQRTSRRINNDFDIIEIYNKVMNNKQVKLLLNPFKDESLACQICYKICGCITCFIVVLVLYSLLKYQ